MGKGIFALWAPGLFMERASKASTFQSCAAELLAESSLSSATSLAAIVSLKYRFPLSLSWPGVLQVPC